MAERADKTKNSGKDAGEPAPPEVIEAEIQPATLSIADIKELFVLMKTNEIAELDLEQQGTKIRIVSTHAPQPIPPVPAVPQLMPMMSVGMPATAPAAPPTDAGARSSAPPGDAAPRLDDPTPPNLKTITSPMVGTFYRTPAPDAAPFIRIGDSVNEETVLCIIEAMKLMNEIKAECKGRVHKIMVDNGVPVEYNQPLFMIEPE